jgi:hypothetical protein
VAHAPEVKAAVTAEIVLGVPYEEISRKHGVGKATINRWAEALKPKTERKPEQNGTPVTVEARRQQFNTALDKFLMSTIAMLQAWADTCSDPAFIRANPEGVNELGKSVLERADRLVHAVESREE